MTSSIAFRWLMLGILLMISDPQLIAAELDAPSRRHLLFITDESTRSDDVEMFNGVPGATPNLRSFFSKPGSILVDQMHMDYPLCNPGRTAILLGISPDTTGVKTNFVSWLSNPNAPSWRTLPRFFKDNGYVTLLGGKVFHRGSNDPTAWDVVFDSSENIAQRQCFQDKRANRISLAKAVFLPRSIGCRTPAQNIPDVILAQKASAQLVNYFQSNNSRPFAMFIGFHLPHFPLRVNQGVFVDASALSVRIPAVEPPRNQSEYQVDYSLNAPKHLVRGGGSGDDNKLNAVPGWIKRGTAFTGLGAPRNYRLALRQLHLSALKQVDSALGTIFNTLSKLALADNTLTVYIADHGFGYGETRLWEKDLPMDVATRVPLLMNAPWLAGPVVHTGRGFFMNGMDVYRTVTGLIGLQDNISNAVQGQDYSGYFRRLSSQILADNDSSIVVPSSSSVAFSQVIRCSIRANCKGTLKNVDVVGYAARTQDFRYIVYFHAIDGQVFNYTRANVIAEELYNHRNDDTTIYNSTTGANFIGHEFHNIANREVNVQVLQDMFELVRNEFIDIPKSPLLPLSQAAVNGR